MKKVIYILTGFLTAMIITLGLGSGKAKADQLYPDFSSTDFSTCAKISDGYYNFEDIEGSGEWFEPGVEITLTSDTPIDSIYIKWYYIPDQWTLRVNGTDYTYGTKGFLHEFVKIPEEQAGATSVTIIPSVSEYILDIYAFSEGELPDFVQVWEDPYEEADILILSTHADDECLFFGGIIPNYTDRDVRVQVAYFTDLFQTESYRAQEQLDGLWEMGVKHYPKLGEFYDYYSESYDEAAAQYNYDDSLEYVVRIIRQFKPQVLVGQDIINGEYGHGGHLWTAQMVADAIEISNDATQYPDSAAQYGTWQVPKTYLHLYPENQILLDARIPLSSLGGRTAVEVAADAYRRHESQQWCWFFVDDDCIDEDGNPTERDLRCTLYGLYNTNVGPDLLGNDIMENITPYDKQTVSPIVSPMSAEGTENPENPEGTDTPEKIQTEGEADAAASDTIIDSRNNSKESGGSNALIIILIIIAVFLAAAIVFIYVVTKKREKEKAEKRARTQARRQKYASEDREVEARYSEAGNIYEGNMYEVTRRAKKEAEYGIKDDLSGRRETARRTALRRNPVPATRSTNVANGCRTGNGARAAGTNRSHNVAPKARSGRQTK